MQMMEYLRYHQMPFVAALTKADKLKKSQLAATCDESETICGP